MKNNLKNIEEKDISLFTFLITESQENDITDR